MEAVSEFLSVELTVLFTLILRHTYVTLVTPLRE